MVAAGGPGGVRVPAEARNELVAIIVNAVAATVTHWMAMNETFLEIASLFIVVSFFITP
jgi:hypothetical protein